MNVIEAWSVWQDWVVWRSVFSVHPCGEMAWCLVIWLTENFRVVVKSVLQLKNNLFSNQNHCVPRFIWQLKLNDLPFHPPEYIMSVLNSLQYLRGRGHSLGSFPLPLPNGERGKDVAKMPPLDKAVINWWVLALLRDS